MNNLLSYCGLTDARMRASETDLPVSPVKLAVTEFFDSGFLQILELICIDLSNSLLQVYARVLNP